MPAIRQPTKGPYATMAAAGTTQATAAELTADKVVVTTITAASAECVILPTGNRDDEVRIVNGTNLDLMIYPRTGGKINNATENLPMILPGYTAAHFIGINAVDWMAF